MEESTYNGIQCSGCTKGVLMCYRRPCWGTPEEFEKLLDSGYASLIQNDYWYREHLEGKSNINVLTAAVYPNADHSGITALDMMMDLIDRSNPMDREYSKEHSGGKKADMNPRGKCVMLDEENKCILHEQGLKPEQGRQACCKDDKAQDNWHYAKLWDTDYGRSVVEKWKTLTSN